MFLQQIEKFQCLKSSTAQGLSPQVLRKNLACVTCPQTCLEVYEFLNCHSLPEGFEFQGALSFPCLSWAIQVKIFYPGTLLKTRDQYLSFGTKIYGNLFIIDEDISSRKKTRGFVTQPVLITKTTQGADSIIYQATFHPPITF